MAHGTDRAQDQARRGGADLSTLVVAALAAVVAALVTAKLWAGGTLVSTAMTPVIVALVKEYLQRPVERISGLARAPLEAVRPATQRYAVPAGAQVSAPPEAERHGIVLEPEPPHPDEYEALDTLVPPGEEALTEVPYRVYRRRPQRRTTWWRVGLVTGLVAFVVAAVVLTVPELVGGGSVAGSGRTTLFSHHVTTKSTPSDKTKAKGKTGTTSSEATRKTSSGSSSSPKSSSGSSSSGSGSSDRSQQSTPGASSGSTTTTPSGASAPPTTPTQTTPSTPTTSTPAPPSSGSTSP